MCASSARSRAGSMPACGILLPRAEWRSTRSTRRRSVRAFRASMRRGRTSSATNAGACSRPRWENWDDGVIARAGGRSSNRVPSMGKEKIFWVYILASKIGGTLYIGVTNDLVRRVFEHRSEVVRGFTKRYGVHRLVYFEQFSDIES